jgi:FlaA1/EpsC-like NDP-sugar epimerase
MKIEKGKLYLITGASGYLGKALTKRIIAQGGRVRAFSRNEGKLIELKQDYPDIEILTGNISDRYDVHQAVQGIDAVFHLAAFKHVGMAEKQVRECINSNTIGSLILLEETKDLGLDFILGISTDKAAQVAGVYGASKLLMERLFTQFSENNPNTPYRIVRYGNVLYSTGSVLCKWKKLIEEGGELVVTDLDATRFYWTVEQALDLIFDCLENSTDTKPHCPDMKALSVGNLLQAMIEKYGNNSCEPNPIKVIGLQPGENLHEKVLDEGPYSNEAVQYTIEEIKELI